MSGFSTTVTRANLTITTLTIWTAFPPISSDGWTRDRSRWLPSVVTVSALRSLLPPPLPTSIDSPVSFSMRVVPSIIATMRLTRSWNLMSSSPPRWTSPPWMAALPCVTSTLTLAAASGPASSSRTWTLKVPLTGKTTWKASPRT